jgi:hypothetical protein
MDEPESGRRPRSRGRALLVGLLVFQVAWLGWGVATILHRAHDASTASSDPRRWRFWTPEVADLRELLDEAAAVLPPGAVIRVDEGRASADPAEIWHWCQYLAPELAFVRKVDDRGASSVRYRLRWNLESDRAGWHPLVARGAFAIDARSTGDTP